MTLKLCANLTFLFTDLPFLDRFEAAAKAGFAGVDVDVKEPGQQNAAGAIDDFRVFDAGDTWCHADDLATLDEHVGCLELGTVFAGDLGVAVKAFHALQAMMPRRSA